MSYLGYEITIVAAHGHTIQQAAANAWEIANTLQTVVTLIFNGMFLKITPNTSVRETVAIYRQLTS